MDTITLCPESVAAYKELMTNPKGNGINMPALHECFQVTTKATPKHILFNQYIELIKKPLPKVFFYIIMDELHEVVKCDDGNLGYNLKIKL